MYSPVCTTLVHLYLLYTGDENQPLFGVAEPTEAGKPNR
jgi:hypothetical protein